MNKKEHQIWQEFKYDEYLFHKHIFSYESLLSFQGKIVITYGFYDSDEAYNFYNSLITEDKKLKTPDVNINLYDNKEHPIWEFDKETFKSIYADYDEVYYDEHILYECELLEQNKPVIESKDFKEIKIWS